MLLLDRYDRSAAIKFHIQNDRQVFGIQDVLKERCLHSYETRSLHVKIEAFSFSNLKLPAHR